MHIVGDKKDLNIDSAIAEHILPILNVLNQSQRSKILNLMTKIDQEVPTSHFEIAEPFIAADSHGRQYVKILKKSH